MATREGQVHWSTADEAVAVISSGDRVFIQGASAVPNALVRAMMDRAPKLSDVEIVSMHTNGPAPYVAEEYAGHLHHRAIFVGPNVRPGVATGRVSYVPIFLSDVPRLFTSRKLPIDVAMLHVSPPDRHGYCSLGTSVDCALAAAKSARIRVAQVNPQMPRTLGDSFVHISQFHHAVSVDEPLPDNPAEEPNEVQTQIGRNIADLVPDGATLQLGIGAIPNATLSQLTDRRDLGIHTEVINDGVVDLVEKGVITGAKKNINKDKIVTAFMSGTRRLFDFVDNNPMVEMHPLDYTNRTTLILQLDNMIAINSALEIDLTGQVCADSIGHVVFSGVGGQMDFMRGAALSNGGKPMIALPATAKHDTVSRITPQLKEGAGVTTSRAHVHYVVTEFGVANLHGLDLAERARALIRLAHPNFREDLERAAREMGMIVR